MFEKKKNLLATPAIRAKWQECSLLLTNLFKLVSSKTCQRKFLLNLTLCAKWKLRTCISSYILINFCMKIYMNNTLNLQQLFTSGIFSSSLLMRKQRCILCKAERMKTLYDLKWHQAILGRASDSQNKNTTAFLLLNSNCALHWKARKIQVQALKVYCHEKLHSVLFSLW